MNANLLTHKQYLGDGVYAGFDGYHLWLYTDNGLEVTDKIALEPEVLSSFFSYLQQSKLRDENIIR